MIKRQEISDPSSCLNKAADDEPVFVFRAQDLTAPYVVRGWLESNRGNLSPEKIAHAEQWIRDAEAWPIRKLPD